MVPGVARGGSVRGRRTRGHPVGGAGLPRPGRRGRGAPAVEGATERRRRISHRSGVATSLSRLPEPRRPGNGLPFVVGRPDLHRRVHPPTVPHRRRARVLRGFRDLPRDRAKGPRSPAAVGVADPSRLVLLYSGTPDSGRRARGPESGVIFFLTSRRNQGVRLYQTQGSIRTTFLKSCTRTH